MYIMFRVEQIEVSERGGPEDGVRGGLAGGARAHDVADVGERVA